MALQTPMDGNHTSENSDSDKKTIRPISPPWWRRMSALGRCSESLLLTMDRSGARASPSMNHLRRLDFFGKSRLRKHLILARRAFRAIAVTRSKPTMRAGDGIAPTSPSGMEPWILRINVEIAISRRRLRGLPTCPDESGRVALVPVRRRHARARRRSDRCAVQGPSSELAEPGVETPPPDHPVEGGVIKHVFLYPFRRGVRRRHIGLLYAISAELRTCGRWRPPRSRTAT